MAAILQMWTCYLLNIIFLEKKYNVYNLEREIKIKLKAYLQRSIVIRKEISKNTHNCHF